VRASNDEKPPLPFGTQPRTMQAWVRTDKLIDQVAMSYGRASPGQGFQLTTEDGFPAVRTGWSSTQVVTGNQFIADDEWHHLAASWDGTLAVLMVDGVLVGIGDLPGDTLEGDIVAGNTPTGDLSKSWIGWLDDVKVLKGTRLPEEVIADLDAETVNPGDLTLHWDSEVPEGSEGPGIEIPDMSGNGHDGLSAGLDTPMFLPCR
jgi:Concanavalin A-like lectin/glucanases superfamily